MLLLLREFAEALRAQEAIWEAIMAVAVDALREERAPAREPWPHKRGSAQRESRAAQIAFTEKHQRTKSFPQSQTAPILREG